EQDRVAHGASADIDLCGRLAGGVVCVPPMEAVCPPIVSAVMEHNHRRKSDFRADCIRVLSTDAGVALDARSRPAVDADGLDVDGLRCHFQLLPSNCMTHRADENER